MNVLRAWLEEKRDKGVTQVRVSSALDKLAEAEAAEQAERTAHKAAVPGRNGKVTITSDDLVGAWEVSQLLQVDRTRPSKWRLNRTTFGPNKVPFPAPFADLKTGPVWLRSQIQPLIPFVEERRRHRD